MKEREENGRVEHKEHKELGEVSGGSCVSASEGGAGAAVAANLRKAILKDEPAHPVAKHRRTQRRTSRAKSLA